MGRAGQPSSPAAEAVTPLPVSVVLLCEPAAPLADGLEAVIAALAAVLPRFELLIAPVAADDEQGENLDAAADASAGSVRMLPPRSSWGEMLHLVGASARGERVLLLTPHLLGELRETAGLLELGERYDIVVRRGGTIPQSWRQRVAAAAADVGLRCLGVAAPDASHSLILARRSCLAELTGDSESSFARTELVASARLAGRSVLQIETDDPNAMVPSGPVPASRPLAYLADAVRFGWNRVLFPGVEAGEAEGATAQRFWGRLALLTAVASALLLAGLSAPLTDPDEGRHAEIAREMWVTGDWLAPRFLNNPYLDKPPLLYWLCVGSFQLFGPQAWAARLVPAVCALLTVLATYGLGRRLAGEASAWCGALVLTMSLGFVTCGRFLILESVLTLFVTTALLTGWRALVEPRSGRGWWLLSAMLCGLGVLTKGPVAGVIVLPPLAMQAWLTRPPQFHRRRWAEYLGVVTAVAAPWYLAVMWRRPEFFLYFFWEQNLNRFLSGTNHPHPVWFYLPVLLIALLPWSLSLVWTARFLVSRNPQDRVRRTSALGFLTLWAGWEVGFFSLAAGKLPYYVLSSLPALALLIGNYLARVLWIAAPGRSPEAVPGVQRLRRACLFACGAAIGVGPVVWGMRLVSLPVGLLLAGGWAAALVGLLAWQRRCTPQMQWRLYCAIAFCGVAMLTQLVVPAWQQRYAVLTPEQAAALHLEDRRWPLLCVDADWGSLPFYTQRDDIVQLPALDAAAIGRFVNRSGTARVLLNDDISLESLQQAAPPGTRVQPLLKTKRAVLVELSRPGPAPGSPLPLARIAAGRIEAAGASSSAAAWP